jgi:hypothetical protein
VPDEFYTRSTRRLPEPYWGRDFPYEPFVFETVRVDKNGVFFWTDQQPVAVSQALRHELLGATWRNPHWDLYFGPLHLGALVRRAGRIRFIRALIRQGVRIVKDRTDPRHLDPLALGPSTCLTPTAGMPWKETDVMKETTQFVLEWQSVVGTSERVAST